jgi:hypothetical protein
VKGVLTKPSDLNTAELRYLWEYHALVHKGRTNYISTLLSTMSLVNILLSHQNSSRESNLV